MIGLTLYLLAQSIAPQAESTPPEQLNPAAAAYRACVVGEVKRLIPSREAAPTIADAAQYNCRKQLRPAAKEMVQASRAALATRGFIQSAELDDLEKAERGIEAEVRRATIAAIVEVKAAGLDQKK